MHENDMVFKFVKVILYLAIVLVSVCEAAQTTPIVRSHAMYIQLSWLYAVAWAVSVTDTQFCDLGP